MPCKETERKVHIKFAILASLLTISTCLPLLLWNWVIIWCHFLTPRQLRSDYIFCAVAKYFTFLYAIGLMIQFTYIYYTHTHTHTHTHTKTHTQLLLKLVKRRKENKHLCCLSSLLDIYWCNLSFHVDFSYILRSFALSLKNFFPYFLSSGSLSSNSPSFCLPENLYIMSSLLKDN